MLTGFYCYEILSALGDSHEQERINCYWVEEEVHNPIQPNFWFGKFIT
jgi:hypothetical protein